MSSPLQMIGAAMRAEVDALRVVSVNIANAETPAYRRQVSVTQAAQIQFNQLMNAGETAAGDSAVTSVAFDLQPGALKSTSEPLHVALDGPGFFALEPAQSSSSQGDLLLTRRGDLRLSPEGYLLSPTGAHVLGNKGPIHVGSSIPTIAADGSVRIDSQLVDELRIVNVANGARLESLGDGTYRADASALSEGDRSASVRQGFLEGSNVVPVNEILQLMETVRRFEAEQKFAHAYDGMLDRAISELGKIS